MQVAFRSSWISCQHPLNPTGVFKKVFQKSIVFNRVCDHHYYAGIHGLFEEYTSFRIVCCGFRTHSSLINCRRSCSVQLGSRRTETALPRSFLTCSIHDKSVDIVGHSILFTLFLRRKSSTVRTWWGLALSSWKIVLATGIWRKNGSTCGVRTPLM